MNSNGLPLSKKLNLLLTKVLMDHKQTNNAVTIHFHDPNYCPNTGGFHPVEISIDERENIQYITDFAYVGSGACVELAKELDFDFSLGTFGQYGRDYPLRAGAEMFRIWQRNFLTYFDAGIYEVELNAA